MAFPVIVLMLMFCCAVGVLGLREVSSLFLNRKVLGRRSNWRFGLPLMFAVTTAVAIACAMLTGGKVARDFDTSTLASLLSADLGSLVVWLLFGLLVVMVLVVVMYLAAIALADLLEGLGWTRPSVNVSEFIARQRHAGPIAPPDQQQAGAAEEPGSEQPRGGRKKRRRWWTARKWSNRWRPIVPGKDHTMPIGRDVF